MRNLFLTLLVLTLLGGALLLRQQKPATSKTAESVAPSPASGISQNAPTSEVPSQPAKPSIPPAQAVSIETDRIFATIPDGPFRDSLLKISSKAREQAIHRLIHINAPKEDYASLRASPDGELFYVCDFNPPTPAQDLAADTTTTTSEPTTQALPVPIANPPIRHSRPGASKVLYLDFNGHTITGTAWNSTVTTYQALPYDTDGDTTTFSDTEQSVIIQVWERVAEDYSTFDVDVTTEEPAVITNTTGRAVITKSTDANGVAMPSSTAGGVAYTDVFDASNYATRYSPAFIYYNNMAGGTTASLIAEAVAHELGHNLGLSHDGQTNGTTYYGGHGSGEISWGPIMGTGYYRNVSQWSKGEYYLANNTQDDVAIIGAYLGFIPDDAGNTIATATTLPVSSNSFSTTGVVNSSTDVDVYSVSLATETVSFSVVGYRAASGTDGGDIDVKLELLDSTGTVLYSADPTASTKASFSYAVTAGNYFIRLTPVGTGSPTSSTPTGYTNYASIGQYTLTGTSAAAVAPTITTQPVSQTVVSGTSASFSVVATGVPTPTYQWKFNGATIAGATNATYTISSTSSANAGPYTVAVTNNLGSITSATATLTVNPAVAPAITTQPVSQSVTAGSSATFTVVATGTPTPTYQWKFNSTALSGATNASFSIASTALSDAGSYTVTVTNSAGTLTSSAATLTVNVAPTITNQPASQTVTAGSSVTFTVVATGTPAPTYQWKFNGSSIAGSTNSTYTISSPAPTDAGAYNVTVTNTAGSITSSAATLTVNVGPTITTQPISQTVTAGSSTSFSVVATGTPTPTFQWKFNGTAIAGATNASYVITSTASANAGGYTVTVTNTAGSLTSSTATLTVNVGPTITTQPTSQTVNAGSAVTFNAAAAGTPSPTYQWKFNGAAISGASNSSYTISFVTTTNAGSYTLTATNTVGAITTTAATLTVNVIAPVINSPNLAGGAIDEPFNYSITANNAPTSFSASGLPAGLTVASTTGVISGTPTASGTFAVTLSATNSAGTGTLALSLLVLPSTTITTVAGTPGVSGSTDSSGTAATFNYPSNIVADSAGILYVTDSSNHTIRKIALNGAVTSFAGLAGTAGSADGSASTARFNGPAGITIDSSGNLYVADSNNSTIRKITVSGTTATVTTLAGSAGSTGTSDGTGTAARFKHPTGLVVDSSGTLYVADSDNHAIRKITVSGTTTTVTTLAGLAGTAGSNDGIGTAAEFYTPLDLALDASGNLFVADAANHTIRKITITANAATVSTVAGQAGVFGSTDGVGTAALLKTPAGLAFDHAGQLYISDSAHTLRQFNPSNGLLITLAGLAGTTGSVDGAGNKARFNLLTGLTVDANNYVFIADTDNHTLRAISSAPIISTQPQTQTVTVGTNVSLSVAASGQPIPSYQWYKDNVAIAGATSTTLTLSNVQTANSGTYTVAVSNNMGICTSNAAILTVSVASAVNSTNGGSGNGGGGGGGGAPSIWFFTMLAIINFVCLARRKS